MRRTTICRSDRVALFALAAVLAVPALRAQDTSAARRQDSIAAAAHDTGLTAQVPAEHTVAAGETLWSIAQLYFGDPLLWPEIYRLNTSVIEDPHWIYPGEILSLAGMSTIAQGADTATTIAQNPTSSAADTVKAQTNPADTVAAQVAPPDTLPPDTTQAVIEAPPPPPPSETYETVFDHPRTQRQRVQDVLRAYSHPPYRPLRRGEFYSAGFLTEQENLPWANVVGGTAQPLIRSLSGRSTAMQFQQIAVRPPSHASYHVGDSLLVARIDRPEPRWGDVVVPLGVARVTEVQKDQVLADIVLQFGRIHDGHLAIPLEPFKDPGEVRPAAVEHGLEARVIDQRDPHELAGAQQIMFLDRGRADGVVLGDVFEVYKPSSGIVGQPGEETRVILMIVHTREHSSSGLVLNVVRPDVDPGMPARLIKKMPS